MDIGPKLRQLRRERDVTQAELGRRANLAKNTISKIERGGMPRPSGDTLGRLADALAVPVGELYEPPVPVPKGSASGGTGPLSRMLKQAGAKTRHLADPDLVQTLEAASDAALERTVREIRQELEVLVPTLRRLRGRVKPGDPDFMPVNRAIGDASKQVLVIGLLLRERGGQEPVAEEIADAGRELYELALSA